MRLVYANLLALFLLFPAAGRAAGNDMILGVCEHLWGANKETIDKVLQAAARAKLSVIRWDVPWKAVEEDKDTLRIPERWDYIVNTGRKLGIDSMMILDYGNPHYDGFEKPRSPEAVQAFARYSAFVAHHFKGRVKYYQIWNEWSGGAGKTRPGNAADYARLVKAVYPVVKSADPAATVVSGSFSTSAYDSLIGYAKKNSVLEDYLSEPGIAQFGDAIAIHPYVVYRDGPAGTYTGFETLLKTVLSKIKSTKGFESKPVFITELGWSTAPDHERGVTEITQRDYLARSIALARSSGIAMYLIYEMRDDNPSTTDPEAGFGLLRHDWSPKPSYNYFVN